MYYTIEVPVWLMSVSLMLMGWVIGFITARVSFKPPKPKRPVDIYDGKHGQGYQPRPEPPQAEDAINHPPNTPMPPLSKPKK